MAARDGKQMGSANGALELIGMVTGLLNNKQQPNSVAVTKIVMILAPGVEPPPELVEATEYRELPRPSPELAEGDAR